ncbi:sugar ABC transporter substrate-binding protein [Rhizobium leguminosarum]|uniref:ABC transporter substrate-binding protein n=1 Tax=Rhizobium leguminosarum TaxID=384 RepID=UPI001C94F496|nr:sugar ABC transporter substrate-binding protein [Rhizobium leguminosarum]MBY5760250.1 sugar ABC transporter substrate-binding protein [Rhizobium leguminosarum]
MGYFKRLSGAMVGLAALITAGSALAQQTTITLLTAERDETMQPVIQGFEKLHPDIKVIHQSVPFNDLNAAIESRIGQGDTSIDVIAADTPRIPAFASKGYLKDLSDRSDEIKAGAPNPVDLEQVSYDGKIYAYPMWTSTQMLYFNRALLKKAGVEFPSADVNKRLTWDQVIDAAKATQKAGAKWGIEFQQFDRYYQLQALFESAGAGSGLTGDGLLKSDVGSEAWVATAKWYGDLFTDEVAPRGVNPEQTDDLFFNGEVAFLVGGPWSISRFEASKDLDYGVAPHPFFKGGKPVTATGSWALAINPKTTHLEAAQAFAEYASLTGEGNYLTTENNPVPPTNPDAFKSYADKMASLAGKIGPVVDLINSELQNTAVGRPRTVGFVAFETVMNKAFADIRNGSDAGETLKSAEKQIDRQLSRLK